MSPKHCLDNRPERSRSERAEMRREATRLRRMQRHILFVALIMLLALGVVSVSFSYFSQEYLKPTDGGSLIFEMRTAAAKRDLADTGAAADLSDTGADADLSDSGAEAALTDTGADADLAETGWYTISNTYPIYFDASNVYSTWGLSSKSVYMDIFYGNNQGSKNIYEMTQDANNPYLYYCASAKGHTNVSGIQFHSGKDSETYTYGTGTKSFSNWSNVMNAFNRMGWYYGTTTNWSPSDLDVKVPPPSMVAFYTEYSGSGTSADPYQVPAGTTISADATVTLGNSVPDDKAKVHFKWNGGSWGSYTATSSNVLNYTSSGTAVNGTTYTLEAEAQGYDGSASSSTVTTKIYFRGVASNLTIQNLSLSASANSVYTDDLVTYTASGDDVVSGATYRFKVGGVTVQNTTSSTYTTSYASTGTNTVTVTVEAEGYDSVTSSSVTTTVTARPAVYFNWNGNGSTGNNPTMAYDADISNAKGKVFHKLELTWSGNVDHYDIKVHSKYDGTNGTDYFMNGSHKITSDYPLSGGGYTYLSSSGSSWVTLKTGATGKYTFYYNATDKVLYVEYPHTVTFNANGHGTAPDSQVISYGGKATTPTAPSVSHYTFGGWYKESGCSNAWNFTTDTVTSDTTLYAKWTPVSYSITLHNNGGETSFSTTSYTIESDTITLPDENSITKTDYDFLGWYANSSFTGSAVTSIPTGSAGNKEYWAKWRERTPWILTFVIDDDSDLEINGSTIMTATYRYPLTGDAIRIDAAKGGASYNDYFDISYVTPAPVNGVYTCTATVTALKDCSDVTFTASLLTYGSTRGETMTAEDDLTVTTPSISDTSAITLYPDQTSGVTKTVTSVDPASVTSIKYYNHGVLSETENNYASVFTVGETTGTITPVAQTTNNAPAAAALYVVVEYNGSYSKQFKRTVNLVQRSVFLPGTGDWSYTGTNNLMSYNWKTGLYEKTKNLSYSESTFEFKVYHTDGGTWYGRNSTTLTSADNTVKLDNGNNVKLTTKDLSSITSSNVPYLFTYNYTSHDLVANYPVTVAYNKNGHGADAGVPATAVKQYGSTLTQPSPLTASGWTFGGWYKEAGCTNQWNFGTDTVTADTTLYAKWTAMTSALTFNINGTGLLHTPSGSMPTNKTATVGSAMPSITGAGDPTLPTCTGYNFDGYYDAASGGNRYYDENGESARVWDKNTPNGEGTTLYAHWRLKTTTVTFSMNTQDTEGETLIGTPAAMSTVTATYGSAMPSINAPSLNGYTFLGFYDTGGTQYYNANGSSAHNWDKEDAACTLTAKWQINTYTVQFIAVYRSGSTTWSSSDTLTPESGVLTGAGTYKYHQNITLTARDTVSGYTLNGIRSGFNTSGPTITPSGDNNYVQTNTGYLSSNVIYYAYYTRNLGVTLAATYTNGYNSHASTMSTFTLTATADGGLGNYSYTYEYSIDGGTYQTIASDSTDTSVTFNPTLAGDYTFKVTVKDDANSTNTYTTTVTVEKDTSTIYSVSTEAGSGNDGTPSITVWGVDYSTTTAGLKYLTTSLSPNGIYGGDKLKITVARPNTNHYIESVAVTMGASTTIYNQTLNRNGDITINPGDFNSLSAGVSGNIVITYVVKPKPTVTIGSVTAGTQSLAYQYEGASATPATDAGTYPVDYGSTVAYTVTPDADHYLESLVSSQGSISNSPVPPSASAVTGSITVTSGDYTLTPTFEENPVVHVNQPEFGSIWVTNSDASAYYLDGEPVPYGTVLKVHVAPNHATSSEYDGSTYHHYHYYDISGVTATAEDESVSSLTTFTTGSQSENVYTHTIEGDTTYSAVITHFTDGTSTTIDTVKKMMSESVPLGYRRIFFTDIYDFAGYSSNNASGEYDLYAHYSLDSGDYGSLTPDPENEGEYLDVDSVRMTYLYKNGQSQKVYYATIPAGARYVSFTNHTVDTDVDPVLNEELGVNVYRTTKYTASYTLFSDKNAFYPGSLAASSTSEYESGNRYWQCHYADIRTVPYTEEAGVYTAGAQYAQQASTGLNRAVEFSFLYDNPYSTGTDGYLEWELVDGDDVSVRFTNTGVRITPTELTAGYSLVKIKSKASLVEKYYLIRIYPVEIKRFDQLQKLFNSSTVSSLTFNMIARGVELSYQFLSSLHNNNDYTAMTSASGIVAGVDEVINGITYAARYLTVNYSDYQFLGMQYFQARITGSGQTDTKEQHTVFDLDSGTADGVLYFKNATRLSVEDIHVKVVARFTTGSEYTWVTMQELDSDNHELLRTPIPTGATSVQFYLMYEDKYSADMASMSPAFYYARSADLSIRAGKMFRVTSLYTMSGSYVNFRQ